MCSAIYSISTRGLSQDATLNRRPAVSDQRAPEAGLMSNKATLLCLDRAAVPQGIPKSYGGVVWVEFLLFDFVMSWNAKFGRTFDACDTVTGRKQFMSRCPALALH